MASGWYEVVRVLILSWFVHQSQVNGYKKSGADLVDIPHDEIALDETVIRLSGNLLTSLAAHEFRNYSALVTLDLQSNKISTVSEYAFCSTSLAILLLNGNQLTSFPNVTCVAATLEEVNLLNNDIHHIDPRYVSGLVHVKKLSLVQNLYEDIPDLTNVSSAVSSSYLIIDDVHPHELTSVCHFALIRIRGNGRSTVPRLRCSPPQVPSLTLMLYDFSMVEDLSNMTINGIRTLRVNSCALRRFPRVLHMHEYLTGLLLEGNEIASISPNDVEGLTLTKLELRGNPLVSFPPQIFDVKVLSLDDVGSIPESTRFWSQALCSGKRDMPTRLGLKGSLGSLAHLPQLTDALCRRESTLTIDLLRVPVPCDCSIAWMADAALRCPVRFLLDHLPCGLSNWTEVLDHLQCPESFVILKTNGSDIMMTNASYVQNNASVHKLIVAGEEKWLVTTTNRTAMDETKWVFGKGTFLVEEDFFVLDELSLQPLRLSYSTGGYDASNVTGSCNDSHNVVMDGLPHSCMSLQPGVQYLSLFPNSSAPRSSGTVMVQTQGLPCSAAFHVMVSAACPHSCPRKHKCELVNSVTLGTDTNTCWYHCACPDGHVIQQVDIRLASLPHTPDAHVCETLWLGDE